MQLEIQNVQSLIQVPQPLQEEISKFAQGNSVIGKTPHLSSAEFFDDFELALKEYNNIAVRFRAIIGNKKELSNQNQ